MAVSVGPRIRALREAGGLSLRDLAERTGVSAPMLSQVERGETSPTLAIAGRIASGLELSLSQLLRLDEGGTVSVIRAGAAKHAPERAGHRTEVLTPALPGQRAELSRHVLAPGAATGDAGDPPLHEPGAREIAHVERGETSPTLSVASRIAAGLELRLSQLLRLDESGTVTIVRAAERRQGGRPGAGGHTFEVLTPPLPGQRAEVSRHMLAPGASTGGPGDPPMHEPGSREIALVEHGRVVLDIDGDRHELAQGDCVTFDADLPHHFENPTQEETALFAVLAAGLRRS